MQPCSYMAVASAVFLLQTWLKVSVHVCMGLKTLKQFPHFERSSWEVSCFVGIVCVPQYGIFSLSDFELVILLVLSHFVLFPADNVSVFLGRIWAPYANMLSLDYFVILKMKIH